MQEITKKNLNRESFGIAKLRRMAVMAISICHYRYFLIFILSTANDVTLLPYLRRENPAAGGLHIK